MYLDQNSVTSVGCPSLLVKNSNVSFCKNLGGLRSLTRVKVFCDLTVNFGEIQHPSPYLGLINLGFKF